MYNKKIMSILISIAFFLMSCDAFTERPSKDQDSSLLNEATIDSEQEAKKTGESYIKFKASKDRPEWEGANVTHITRLYSLDNILQAFELKISNPNNKNLGYIIVEAGLYQPLISVYSIKGKSKKELIDDKFFKNYKTYPDEKNSTYLWAGSGTYAISFFDFSIGENRIITLEDHPNLPSYMAKDRLMIDIEKLDLSKDEWVKERINTIQNIMNDN